MYPGYPSHQRMMPPAMPSSMPPTMERTMQPVHMLHPSSCQLHFRQEPVEALVTVPGKEKARKPVDPPPILELTVSEHDDPQQQFLQSPYLFVSATLFKAEKDEPVDAGVEKALLGTLVSSIQRLKDVNNKDGGFFVFGDISVKLHGSFRLRFTLFNFQPETNEVHCLATTTSAKFKVVLAKEFRGMDESTYLSRAFADQGVRLRLRKEARAVKRSYSTFDNQEDTSSPKRQRQEVQITPYPPVTNYQMPSTPNNYPAAPTFPYQMPFFGTNANNQYYW